MEQHENNSAALQLLQSYVLCFRLLGKIIPKRSCFCLNDTNSFGRNITASLHTVYIHKSTRKPKAIVSTFTVRNENIYNHFKISGGSMLRKQKEQLRTWHDIKTTVAPVPALQSTTGIRWARHGLAMGSSVAYEWVFSTYRRSTCSPCLF